MDQLRIVAFALSLFGGVHDLLTRKIPNWFTFPAMLAGICAQAWLFGWTGLIDSTFGLLLGFALLFPVYFLGYMGAGDVKLLMAVGAWAGWSFCWQVGILAVVYGAAYALVEIIFRGRLRAVVKSTYSFLRSLFLPGLVMEKLKLDEQRKFAFGICISAATASVIYLLQSGRLL